MWMITTDGMFSAVQATDDPDLVVVRTRVKADVEALHAWLRNMGAPSEILAYEFSDYPWRTVTTRWGWAEYVRDAAERVEYPNFKAEVARVQGKARATIYGHAWEDLLALEGLDPERTFSRWATSDAPRGAE